jgi:tripartite ATP-independent transporter DctP family solute receptor
MIKIVMAVSILLVAFAPVFAGGGGEAVTNETKQYVAKLAHSNVETDPLHITAQKVKELFEQQTNNRIRVDIYSNAQLGDDQDIIPSMRSGAIEMGIVASANAQASTPSIGAIMLPYMYTGSEQAWKAFDAVQEELSTRMIREAGVRLLAIYEKGFRVLTNSKKPIVRLSDLQGLKIRVSPSEIPLETFKSWDIDPIPMAWGEVFTALQQKVIDGQENPYSTIPATKFEEVQKYVTEIHYMIYSGPLVMNERFFQSLPDDLKAIVISAGKESAAWERKWHDGITNDVKAQIEKAGMILSGAPVDEDEWQRRAKSIWPRLYEKAGGKEWCEQVIKIVDSVR